jgi:2-oxoisovalerate dehydrogenase E1 component beta subunit
VDARWQSHLSDDAGARSCKSRCPPVSTSCSTSFTTDPLGTSSYVCLLIALTTGVLPWPNLAQAIRLALHYGETHLGVTDIFGEDVGPPLGGVFTCTQGLKTAWNAPLDERGIIGAALGIAYAGGKPVAEIQFCDYIYNVIDMLKLCGNAHWSSAGEYHVPLVVMTPVGAGIHGSMYHSHSFESMATHMGGWKIVLPSNAKDAYGLMLSAIADPNPVLFMAPKGLMRAKCDQLIPGEPEDERSCAR